jgi:hypothetical protein
MMLGALLDLGIGLEIVQEKLRPGWKSSVVASRQGRTVPINILRTHTRTGAFATSEP